VMKLSPPPDHLFSFISWLMCVVMTGYGQVVTDINLPLHPTPWDNLWRSSVSRMSVWEQHVSLGYCCMSSPCKQSVVGL
jgi:hypothetical protein